MSKIDNCKKIEHPIFQGIPEYTYITTITFNMHLLIEIRHDTLIKCKWSCIEVEKFNNMLEIDIFRNSSQRSLGVLRDGFEGLGVQMTPRGPAG